MVSLSIHRMLYDGIRQMESQDLVLTGLGPLDRGVILAEVPPFPFGSRRPGPPRSGRSWSCARRRVTLRRLAWEEGGLSFPRLRAAYALVAGGMLRDADQAPARQPTVQAETGMFLLSALDHRPDPSLRDAIRREVEQELEHSAHLDRESWLKVARTAPKGELIRALEEKMERYHALRDAVEEADSLRKDIDVILGRASSALRLAKQAPGAAPAATAAARRAAQAARAALPELRVEEELALTVEGPVDETRPPLEDESADTDPVGLAGAPSPSSRPRPSPRRLHPRRPPGSTDFSGRAKVEHLLMEGEVRMTVADYANAVKVYEKLVKVAPKVAAFRLRLAIAMACYPRTAKLAERQFFEASRLDPANADVHYQWGLYYKVMKIKSRAVAEMRTAVRLNPRHNAAREELEALSPRDSALTSLKKLFR